MFSLLIFVTVAAAGVAVALRRRERVGALGDAALRWARIRLRAHRLADLHRVMVGEALAHRVPGLSQDYLPNRLAFGWHPADMARWAQLRGHIEVETAQILQRAAIERGFLLVGDIVVVIREDATALPGRPTLQASSRPGQPELTRLNPTRARREPCTELLVRRAGAEPDRLELRGELVVGRDPGAGLRVSDDTVSARHARFTVSGDEVRLADLGSANGTFVNGRRIDGESVLAADDVVAFGDCADRVVVGHRKDSR